MTGLIVALDDPDLDVAESLAKEVSDSVDAFKVGLTLFTSHGPEAVERIGAHGRVFLDLKLHDISHQVGLATAAVSKLGIWMLTVHASGGPAMVGAAVDAASQALSPPLIAGVTVLTSISIEVAESIGWSDPKEQVVRLARLAVEAGAPALVCSGEELTTVRDAVGSEVVLVVPGVRPAGADHSDQARVVTPRVAAEHGADFIVVGRPITAASDPAAAARDIAKELR